MSKGNYMCALRSFFLFRFFAIPNANKSILHFFAPSTPLSTCVRPRTWAEVSSPQNTDSAQERKGFSPVQSRMASTSPHETLSNQGKDDQRAPTPPQKGRVSPCPIRGGQISPHETLSNQGKDYLRGLMNPPCPGKG